MRGMNFLDIFSNWTPSEAWFLAQAAIAALLFAVSPLPNLISKGQEAWADRIIAVFCSLKTGSAPSVRDRRA